MVFEGGTQQEGHAVARRCSQPRREAGILLDVLGAGVRGGPLVFNCNLYMVVCN